MRRTLLPILLCGLFLGVASAWSAECVTVDIELPGSVQAAPGAFADGYFELTNCGDEAAIVTLSVTIAFGNIPPFEIGGIQFPLGAGEVVSREFRVPVPPNAAGNEVSICIEAAIGESVASDCATTVISGAEPTADSRTTGFLALADGDCAYVVLELPDEITIEQGASFADGYFELTNCGDESALVQLSVSIQLLDTTITVSGIRVPLGAGETISREFRMPVPPIVPAGEYGVCVTATVGESMASACQTIVIVKNQGPMGAGVSANNHPNPFNPSTTISFSLPTASYTTVSVYNTLGQLVEVLHEGMLSAGDHQVQWDGNTASSGVYFYRIEAGGEVVSKKMVLTK